MIYALAHFLRDKCPFIWTILDWINAYLFSLGYGKKLHAINFELQEDGFKDLGGYRIIEMSHINIKELVAFFASQPDDAFTYFRPHGFDETSLHKLQQNKSFLAYFLVDETNNKLAAYCFIRAFFHGKGFRGRMVDVNYRGKGLGTRMNKLMNNIGFCIGLRLFESVSKNNIASYRSALSASGVKIIKEMPHNEVYLEILNLKK